VPDIAFLLGDTTRTRHDNHRRLPEAFERAGWRVAGLPQDAVHLGPDGIRLGTHAAQDFDLIWVLGLGRLETFFDRMQLLHQLPQARLVTGVDALTYHHAKYAWWQHMPETYASAEAGYLLERLGAGGDWVVKPPAGSFGRDVRRIRDDATGRAAVRRATAGGRYCLLQRYAPQIQEGEKRTLVAGGRVIGSYLRYPETDLRANLAAGASAHATTLTPAEQALVDAITADLAVRGVGFAAVDQAHPHLMEVNLANPGGLATLEALYGEDPADRVVAAIAEWRGSGPGTP